MLRWILLSSIALCLFGITVEGQNASTLQLVQMLFRHGDRAPITMYPKDSYRNFWEEIGPGQLTQTGMRHHYELGTFMRNHYSDFLDEYAFYQVKVRSSDVDRTLMSVECNLAALFPPTGDQIWNKNLLWQPIPIHTVPASSEFLLKPDSGACKRYNQIREETESSDEMKKILAKYKDFMTFLTGEMGANITRLEDIWNVYDLLKIERLYNFTLPDWVDKNFDEMTQIAIIHFNLLYPNTEARRITGGPVLGEMIANIENKISDQSNRMKLYYYSAHDITIAAFLINLNIFNNILPPYASAILVEHHEIDGENFVKMLYRNDTTHEPYPLALNGCPVFCPLKTFEQLTKDVIPTNIKDECQPKQAKKKSKEEIYIRNLVPSEKHVHYRLH